MKKVFLLSIFLFTSLMADKPIRVYVDVVGDLFHAGHVAFFQKAKEFGDILIVGVHSDEDVTDYKRRPILTMEERVTSIKACRYVDQVIENAPLPVTKELLKELEIDFVVHGDDFNPDMIHIHYGVPIEMGIFKTVPYTPGISTTDIINRIKNRQ
jgi:cytidyltransferase-like protein